MDRIIFATSNEGKMKEIREIMSDLSIPVVSLKEAGIDIEIIEDGETFEDNALIKAKKISEITGEIVLSDDSGLEVDYLDKAPGVYSARFMGENTSYTEKNNAIIEKLKEAKGSERSARFVCVIAAAFPDGKTFTTRAEIEGEIAYEERGFNGFGYDPILYVPEFDKTTGEMNSDEKNKISHRGKALEKMKEILRNENINS